MSIVVVVGGQFGGAGKGKMTAHLCHEYRFDIAVRCGGPNSGHTITGRRIFQRGRSYEIAVDLRYFKEYNDKVKHYFKKKAQSEVYFFDVDDLELDPNNIKLRQIRDKILELMESKYIRKGDEKSLKT